MKSPLAPQLVRVAGAVRGGARGATVGALVAVRAPAAGVPGPIGAARDPEARRSPAAPSSARPRAPAPRSRADTTAVDPGTTAADRGTTAVDRSGPLGRRRWSPPQHPGTIQIVDGRTQKFISVDPLRAVPEQHHFVPGPEGLVPVLKIVITTREGRRTVREHGPAGRLLRTTEGPALQ